MDLATTPVASGIQPPPSPLGNLSGILGIQQQSQNLQTGQYKQQEAQAGATQAQQQNSELQALAKFTKAAAQDPTYLNADGSPNVAKYQQGAMAVAPVYGQAYLGQMTQNFNGDVENRKALLGLGKEQQGTIATALQSIAQDPQASHESAVSTIGNLRGLSSDPAFQSMLDRTLGRMPNTGMVPDKQGTSTIQQWAARAAAATGGPPLASPSSVDTGGAVQPGQTSNYTGAFQPSGGAIPKTLAPSVITNPTTGGPAQIGGAQGTIPKPIGPPASPNAALGGNSGGWQPAPGQQQIQANIEADRRIGDQVGVNRDINSRILKLADQTSTGPGTGWIHNIAAAAGLPSGASYQELGGFLDRQAAMAGQAMGLPDTNAGLETAKQFTGNTQYDNQVIKDKTKFVDALNTGAAAYRAGLDRVVGTGQNPNYGAYQRFRSTWAQNFDPNVFAYENAYKRGDTAAMDQIKADEGRRGMADLMQKRKVLMGLVNGQQ